MLQPMSYSFVSAYRLWFKMVSTPSGPACMNSGPRSGDENETPVVQFRNLGPGNGKPLTFRLPQFGPYLVGVPRGDRLSFPGSLGK